MSNKQEKTLASEAFLDALRFVHLQSLSITLLQKRIEQLERQDKLKAEELDRLYRQMGVKTI